MKWSLAGFFFAVSSIVLQVQAQGIDWVDRQENMPAGMSQTVRVPIRIRNTTDKPQFITVRKAQSNLGGDQRGYFCAGEECYDPSVDQFTRKVEAGETVQNLYYVIETGLNFTSNSIRFEIYPKGNPALSTDHIVSLTMEEKTQKSLVFQSRDITIHDVYPNPVADQAFIDYKINGESVKAKVVIHNILGSSIGNYELPAIETRIKINADDLIPGVYFYTVYVNNVGVLTRKIMVRK